MMIYFQSEMTQEVRHKDQLYKTQLGLKIVLMQTCVYGSRWEGVLREGEHCKKMGPGAVGLGTD